MNGSRAYTPTPDLLQQSNRIGVQFLLAELETGLTFLAVAGTTSIGENRARNIESAHQAFRTVHRLLPRVLPSPEEKLQINGKMDRLKQGLLKAGCALEA